MCGRYALGLEQDQLEDVFEVSRSGLTDWSPRWNIAPTSTIPIVIGQAGPADYERVLGPARWSLTPAWSDTLDTPYPTFNARSETAATKPTFRQAVAHTRALIPASGYFEWHTAGRIKTPHYIHQSDRSPLALAGLYSVWDRAGEPVVTATILTRPAPFHLEWIHHRAPVVLGPEDWDSWLDPTRRGDQALVDWAVDASEAVYATTTEHEVLPLQADGPQLIAPKADSPTTA